MKTLSTLLLLSFALLAQFGCSWGWNGYVEVNIKFFLQGPFDNEAGNSMKIDLRDNGYLPLTQPYNDSPWNYLGTESVDEIPSNVVDWVLVELREDTTKVITRKAGFLLSGGLVVDLDGINPLKIKASPNKYYIVIYHRNHLAAMSAEKISLKRHSILYDFTISIEKYYGETGAEELDTDIWGVVAADGNADGYIGLEDYELYQISQGNEGYEAADYNLDGGVFLEDFNLYQLNQGRETGVPALGE